MTRAGSYSEQQREQSTRRAKDTDVVVGNGIALIGVIAAITLAVIGLLVGFDMIGTSGDAFQNGMLWLVGGLVVAIAANAFRREHHVVEPSEMMER